MKMECELIAASLLIVVFVLACWVMWQQLIISEYRRKFWLMRRETSRLRARPELKLVKGEEKS